VTAQINLGTVCPTGNWAPPEADGPPGQGNYDSTPIWFDKESNEPLAVYYRINDRESVYIEDAVAATNRYIARNDNAALFAGLVRSLAKPGGKVVFIEASVGNIVQQSLLDIVGGWAISAWWQILLLGAVVIYTMGKRFGIADVTAYRQRGTRELVDAVADVYKRSGATHAALEAVYKDCDRRVRQALKLGRDASRSTRDDLLPDDLAKAFFLCESASHAKAPEGAALKLAQQLEDKTDAFLGTKRRVLRRRRR
jgi:hypothetical protein